MTYCTRQAIYLTRQGTAVLAGDPQAAQKLYPAGYTLPRRVAERYGLAALEGAVADADVPFSDVPEEKAHAAPPATKARSGPQTTKRRHESGPQESP